MRRGLRLADGRATRRGRSVAHVGDRKDARRCGEGVRSHDRLHPGHDRRAEGARPRLFPLLHPGGDHRPDPPGAARRGPLHGAVQLPPERDLHDPDSRAHHGEHRHRETAEARGAPVRPAARGLSRRLPRGRGELHLWSRRDRDSAAHGFRARQCPGLHRDEPGGGQLEGAAPSTPPAALRARPGREESGDPPARRGPRPRRERVRPRRPVLQRAALHGAQDLLRAPIHRGRFRREDLRGRERASRRDCRGRMGPRSRHCPSRASRPASRK